VKRRRFTESGRSCTRCKTELGTRERGSTCDGCQREQRKLMMRAAKDRRRFAVSG
jgi:hypothetical protein